MPDYLRAQDSNTKASYISCAGHLHHLPSHLLFRASSDPFGQPLHHTILPAGRKAIPALYTRLRWPSPTPYTTLAISHIFPPGAATTSCPTTCGPRTAILENHTISCAGRLHHHLLPTHYLKHLPTRGSRSLPAILPAGRIAIPASYHQLRRSPSVTCSPSTISLIFRSSRAAACYIGIYLRAQDSNISLIPSVALVAFHHYLVNFHQLQHFPLGVVSISTILPVGAGNNTNIIPSIAPVPPTISSPILIDTAAPKISLLDLGLALALGGTLDIDMDLDPESPMDAFSGP